MFPARESRCTTETPTRRWAAPTCCLHYRDSLVVFDTTSRAAEGTVSEKQTVYESKVVARRDFEFPTTIEVKR